MEIVSFLLVNVLNVKNGKEDFVKTGNPRGIKPGTTCLRTKQPYIRMLKTRPLSLNQLKLNGLVKIKGLRHFFDGRIICHHMRTNYLKYKKENIKIMHDRSYYFKRPYKRQHMLW